MTALLMAALLGSSPQVVPLPGHGELRIALGETWKVAIAENGSLPPTVRFFSTQSHAKLVLTPIWSPSGKRGWNAPAKLRPIVEQAAAKEGPASVEGKATLFELQRKGQVAGYAFTVTDPAPKPGEYVILTQGEIAVDALGISFSFFYDAPSAPELREVLDALRSAEWVGSSGGRRSRKSFSQGRAPRDVRRSAACPGRRA
jgi:hypothetical protein